MPMKPSTRNIDPLMSTSPDESYVSGFAVVVERVVGEVTFGADDVGRTAHHAALDIIGSTNEEGRFSFPNEAGGRTVVEVTFPMRDER